MAIPNIIKGGYFGIHQNIYAMVLWMNVFLIAVDVYIYVVNIIKRLLKKKTAQKLLPTV